MVSYPSANEVNVAAEKSVEGCHPNKNGQVKVPKKIHKAEREKLKRDQLNELFLELGHALEPDRQNNCKASILGDTTRILRDLFAQVESLRRENAALQSESCYVAVERNELKDENSALLAEISELQNELQRRMRSDHMWTNNADTSSPILQQQTATVLSMQNQPFVIQTMHAPPPRELQLFPEPTPSAPPPAAAEAAATATTTTSTAPEPFPHVRRPHARYATQSDPWPAQLLSTLPRTTQQELCSSSSVITTSSNEEGSDALASI